jgi:hypothetical protein
MTDLSTRPSSAGWLEAYEAGPAFNATWSPDGARVVTTWCDVNGCRVRPPTWRKAT